MKNYFFLFCILFSVSTSFSQELLFEESFQIKSLSSNSRPRSKTVLSDGQNNTYFLGSFRDDLEIDEVAILFPPDADSFIFFVAKFSANGNLAWIQLLHPEKREVNLSLDQNDNLHAYFLDWRTDSYVHEVYDQDWNRLDSTTIIEVIEPGVNGILEPIVEVDSAKNIYYITTFKGSGAIRFYNREDTIFFSEDQHIYIAKYDSTGNNQWITTIRSDEATQLHSALNNQEELIIAGTFQRYLHTPTDTLSGDTGNGRDIYAIQFDTLGAVNWARQFGLDAKLDYCNQMAVFGDAVYLTGTLQNGLYTFDSLSAEVVVADPFLLRLNGNGQASSFIHLPLNFSFSAGRTLDINETGQIIWGGQYSGVIPLLAGDTLPPVTVFQGRNLFLLLLEDRDSLTIRSIHSITGQGALNVTGTTFRQSNHLVMGGSFAQQIDLGIDTFRTNTGAISNLPDLYLTFVQFDDLSQVHYQKKIRTKPLELFPNPNYGVFTLRFPNQDFVSKNLHLNLFDNQGQLIMSERLKESRIDLSRKHLSKGIYFITVSDGSSLWTGSVLIN